MSVGKLTNNIKNLLAESARNDIRNTEKDDTYYIYIAYSDSEDYPFADSDLSESTLDSDLTVLYKNIVTMHRVLPGGVSRVIDRKNWVRNSQYIGWYNGIQNDSDYYVLTTEIIQGVARQNVYKCLFSPTRTISTIAPTGTGSQPFRTADEYVWQFMYTVTNSEALLFQNSLYMPVPEKVTKSEAETLSTSVPRYSQYQVQNNAVEGGVYNIRVNPTAADSDVINFTNKTTIKIRGLDGTGSTPSKYFQATATRNNDSDRLWNFVVTQFGENYDAIPFAVDSEDNTKLSIFKLDIAPGLGHGTDAGNELNASNLMLTSRSVPADDTGFAKLATNDFSVLGVIKNPVDANTDLIATKDYYTVAEKILTDIPSLFQEDEVFYKSGDSDYAGKVIASVGRELFYINVGKLENVFADSDSLISSTHSNGITKKYGREIKLNSGTFITVDYLTESIKRSADQIESLNIILKL